MRLSNLSCFKTYDVRGKVPEELDEDLAFKIGLAYAQELQPDTVAVGRDVRLSSPELCSALISGLVEGGVAVKDIGLCGTEEIYHAVFSLELGGGIMVTASHNPAGFNGMKFVREEARPVSADTGLNRIKDVVERGEISSTGSTGSVQRLDNSSDYINHLLAYISLASLRPLKIVVNPGNGGAGRILDLLEPHLPYSFIKVNYESDGTFPNGVPNPLLPDNREATSKAVIDNNADLGIAWDGDFDRCFFFDEQGGYIEGYYLVGLLAEFFLRENPGEKVLHDPRLVWNTRERVLKNGGIPIETKTGHAFIKERMRMEDAVYGGEMSSHHYFRHFSYCDSGMIPWLLLTEHLCTSGNTLSELVGEAMAAYPSSGEINRKVADPESCFSAVRKAFTPEATAFTEVDGMSLDFGQWRFNLRSSNTEPVIRLNVESKGDVDLMKEKTQAVLSVIETYS